MGVKWSHFGDELKKQPEAKYRYIIIPLIDYNENKYSIIFKKRFALLRQEIFDKILLVNKSNCYIFWKNSEILGNYQKVRSTIKHNLFYNSCHVAYSQTCEQNP